ncbi:hypothetical protein JRO89_XS12G0190200 [Xanthoceras sorbifolium]|uniref:Uncharacterized protein n=1 Tax=Xanthoceras sorbifolium TaxID=99658 RepID=A0ABQ8HD36_9ROSI|nr:hypothetical protein JRO89_XS12G0190200 [Xanthoceras sorbifolium]
MASFSTQNTSPSQTANIPEQQGSGFGDECGDDIKILQKYVKHERIFDFLAGLSAEFDQVCVQVLGNENLPSLNEVFSIIAAEAGRRLVMHLHLQ